MLSPSARTLRDFAVKVPGAIELFEELGLDYCCGGNIPLEQACAKADIDPGIVRKHLEKLAADPQRTAPLVNWATAPLPELIDHILNTHHEYTRLAMRRIPVLLDKVVEAHEIAHPEVRAVRNQFRMLAEDLTVHLQKEETVLFPYIRDLVQTVSQGTEPPRVCFPTVAFPIRMMETEHEAAGLLLDRMRAASGNYLPPDDACPTFIEAYRALMALETDLHRHIHLENNILHPRTIGLEAEYREMTGSHPVS